MGWIRAIAGNDVNVQTILWFGIAGGALLFGLSLLHKRYIAREDRAVQSRGAFTLFAAFAILFAFGALAAGIASIR